MNNHGKIELRYGCCVNMVTKTENVSGVDIVPVLKELGFDYADLSLSHLCAMDDATFSEVKTELLSFGFPMEACNNFFPAEIRLTGPNVDKEVIVRYLDKAFQRASDLGIKVIVFGSGMARMVPEGFPMHEAVDQLSELLKIVDQYAQRYSIEIAIEPLRRQECNIVNTYLEAIILADIAKSDKIRCLLDSYHLTSEEEDISVIQTGRDMLAHVHFAEQVGRVFPRLENKQTYKDFIKHLQFAQYTQRLSIEAYSEDFVKDAKRALALLKEIEVELNYQ